jgi:hypothetical protein
MNSPIVAIAMGVELGSTGEQGRTGERNRGGLLASNVSVFTKLTPTCRVVSFIISKPDLLMDLSSNPKP